MKTDAGNAARRRFIKDAVMTGAFMAAAPRLTWSLLAQRPPVKPGPADWSRFGYDLHNTRFNSKEDRLGRSNVGQLKLKWTHTLDTPVQTTPTVVGDTTFFGTISGYQFALDSATGEQKWKFFAGYASESMANRGVRSSSQYYDGRIYFGTGLAKVHCVDATTGKELWQTVIDEQAAKNRTQIFFSPTVYKDKVYIGTSSAEAQIACLDAKTGKFRWRFYVVPDRSRKGSGSVWTSAAIDEPSNTVYFVTGSVKSFMPPDPMLFTESIIAFDCDTGEMIWYDQARPADVFDLDYSCHPMIFDAMHPSREQEIRKCVAAGNKGGMFCFNRHTGERYWKTMLTGAGPAGGGPAPNSTAVAYNRVFVVSNATGVRGRQALSVTAALHAYTGDIMWWIANPATINGPVAVANQVFYQGLADGMLEAIDVRNGEQLWKYQLPGMVRSGMAIANGTLYTSTGDTLAWTTDEIGKKSYGVYAFTPNSQ